MTNWVSSSSGTVRRHWIVPRSVMCALFWTGVILVFTGMILLVTSNHKGKMYESWGAVLLGLGLCFLLICLILCIHAYCVISAVSRAEIREKSLSKRGADDEENTLRPYLAAAVGTASALINGPKPRTAVGTLVAPPKFDANIQPRPHGTARLSGLTAGAVTTIPFPSSSNKPNLIGSSRCPVSGSDTTDRSSPAKRLISNGTGNQLDVNQQKNSSVEQSNTSAPQVNSENQSAAGGPATGTTSEGNDESKASQNDKQSEKLKVEPISNVKLPNNGNSLPAGSSTSNPVRVQLMTVRKFAKFRDAITRIQNSDSPPSYRAVVRRNDSIVDDKDNQDTDDIDLNTEQLANHPEEWDNPSGWKYPSKVPADSSLYQKDDKPHSDSLSYPSTTSSSTLAANHRRDSYRRSRDLHFGTVHEGVRDDNRYSLHHPDLNASTSDVTQNSSDVIHEPRDVMVSIGDITRPEMAEVRTVAVAAPSLHSSRDSSLSRHGSSFETVVLAEGFEASRQKGNIVLPIQRKIAGQKPQYGLEQPAHTGHSTYSDRTLPRSAPPRNNRNDVTTSDMTSSMTNSHVPPQYSSTLPHSTESRDLWRYDDDNDDDDEEEKSAKSMQSLQVRQQQHQQQQQQQAQWRPQKLSDHDRITRPDCVQYEREDKRKLSASNPHQDPVQPIRYQSRAAEAETRTLGSICGVKVTPIPSSKHLTDSSQGRALNQQNYKGSGQARCQSYQLAPPTEKFNNFSNTSELRRHMREGGDLSYEEEERTLTESPPMSYGSDERAYSYEDDDDECSNIVNVYEDVESKATVYDNVQYLNM